MKHKSMLWTVIACSTALCSPIALAMDSPTNPVPQSPETQKAGGQPEQKSDSEAPTAQQSTQEVPGPQNQKQLPYGNKWLESAQRRAQMIRNQNQGQQTTQPSQTTAPAQP